MSDFDKTIQSVVSAGSCTGCGSCCLKCPSDCLSMVYDDEGFLTPSIDWNKCINCGNCLNKCHAGLLLSQEKPKSSFIYYTNDKSVYEKSASGGAFVSLAQQAIGLGYTIYGAAFDRKYAVRHVSIDNTIDLEQIQGSKYAQSNIEGLFLEIEKKLKGFSKVLFSGTPCQVASLLLFLGSPYENLVTVDIVCHGVPSPVFWERHVSERIVDAEGRYPNLLQFRTKSKYDKYGYILTSCFPDHKKTLRASEDLFYSLFMDNLSLRECCYNCKYATSSRISDITLGDCASIDAYPSALSKSPVSIIMLNTDVGLSLFDSIVIKGYIEPLDYDLESSMNAQLNRPSARPNGRDGIYHLLLNSPYDELEEMYLTDRGIARDIKNRIKWAIPWEMRLKLKKLISRR